MKAENSTCTNITLEILDSEPGYYQYVIRPMLHPGHEGELCTWLKEMGLMQRSVRCQKSASCNMPMKWTQSRSIDKYQWQCDECFGKRPIRDRSFFEQTKCSITSIIRIILGWCKDMDVPDIVEVLHVKSHMVKQVYRACNQIVENYVPIHWNDWRLGGNETIVLIDLFPDGCAKVAGANPEYQNNNPTQILCLAEAKSIPTKYWFHVMTSGDSGSAKIEALNVVRNMVKPGSILVADSTATVCSHNHLQTLKEYPIVVSIASLMKHNKPDVDILHNIETIWEEAIHICEEAQNYPRTDVESYLYNMLWRRRFSSTPSTTLESLLHHIADHYPTTTTTT